MIAVAIMMLNTLEVRYCKGARDHLYILCQMLDDSMIAMLMLNINYLAIPRNYDKRYLDIGYIADSAIYE